jgi:aryl-alcohol dehydrogenase-like predicted oxidoreductase
MEKRKLGQSDVKVSVITFGAWAIGGWMWGGTNRRDAIDAIHASLDSGVTSIDTAPAYGQGLSEEIVGEAIKGLDRRKIEILTKFGLRWDTNEGEFFFSSTDIMDRPINMHKFASAKSVIKECEESLKRLGTDYIDLYQIHWPDKTTPISETMEALNRLIEQGKIRAAGVSNYSIEQMTEAERYIRLASNQVAYSMVNRSIERTILPYCVKNNKAIIAYSPLQRGLLTGKIKPGHLFNEGDTRQGNTFYTNESIEEVNTFLNKLKPLAESKNATISQLIIRWTIEQPGITIALVGARNSKQATENARAAEIELTGDDLNFINDELDKLNSDI